MSSNQDKFISFSAGIHFIGNSLRGSWVILVFIVRRLRVLFRRFNRIFRNLFPFLSLLSLLFLLFLLLFLLFFLLLQFLLIIEIKGSKSLREISSLIFPQSQFLGEFLQFVIGHLDSLQSKSAKLARDIELFLLTLFVRRRSWNLGI